jgi:hypothetical protein
MPSSTALTKPRPEVRQAVSDVLMKSKAFAAMPPEKQRAIAQNTARVSDYLAAPEGFEGHKLPGGLGASPSSRAMADTTPVQEGGYQQDSQKVDDIGKSDFKAGAVAAGVQQSIAYIQGVNFPGFVSGLISGVFQAIVNTSIQQMEEYSKMIAAVSQSLDQFMKDNISENQGRDHLKDRFPDIFDIGVDDMSDDPQPRLQLRDGVDQTTALARVNSSISFENGELKSLDVSDENVEHSLVVGAQMQLAKQRQQLMASMVLLGINRIVVTDGKIAAKVIFDFNATSGRDMSRTATAYDMARNADGTVQTSYAGQGTYEGSSKSESDKDSSSAERYAKGTYQYENRPIITAMSAAKETSQDMLVAKANLTGEVHVNFKSDYLPLDKMATPGMIAAIQGNSTPVDPNVLPSARVATPPAAAPAATAAAPAPAAARA